MLKGFAIYDKFLDQRRSHCFSKDARRKCTPGEGRGKHRVMHVTFTFTKECHYIFIIHLIGMNRFQRSGRDSVVTSGFILTFSIVLNRFQQNGKD